MTRGKGGARNRRPRNCGGDEGSRIKKQSQSNFNNSKRRKEKMQSKIKNGNLVIELPLEKPRPSKTGKTLLIASTRGVKRLEAQQRSKCWKK
jgi:hypothetical protein